MGVVKPKTAADVAEALASSSSSFEIVGSGSKRGLGHTVAAEHVLDLSALSRIVTYEPEELIIEAEPGVLLADVVALLESKNQMLAFEPPRSGTLGGLLNCNLSGSRRLTAGAARDHVLGIHAVDGRGVAFKAGGRVVKNVTGYDMPKLIAGSHGTLAAVTSLVFKVLPKPETEETLVVAANDTRSALETMTTAMGSAYAVSCAAYAPGRGVLLRVEGIAPSVTYRRDQLSKLLDRHVDVLNGQTSSGIWHDFGNLNSLHGFAIIWRVSLPPTCMPTFIDRLSDTADFTYVADWAGGLVWIGTQDAALQVRSKLEAGHATLYKAPSAMRKMVPVFQPQDSALRALSERVKDAFDPAHRLNPGRMYGGL